MPRTSILPSVPRPGRTLALAGLLGWLGLALPAGCTLDFPEAWLYENCGNGAIDENEECDDGDRVSGNGCSEICQREDGFYCEGEPSVCTTHCGDRIVAGNEECDDGNTEPGDGCSAICLDETGGCGDGTVDATEGCDDGNRTSMDGCSAACQEEVGWNCAGVPSDCEPLCGDGLRVGDEECDDADLPPAGGDGCSAVCEVEDGWFCTGAPSTCVTDCGDGVAAGEEGCDDGGNANGDGCTAGCEVEPGWTCDASPCTPICGDFLLRGGETCDDGNTTPNDGCSAACQEETGWQCDASPVGCHTVCGDGLVRGTETCDDGDLPPAAGDGCDASCLEEHGYECVGEPSVCSTTCGDGLKAASEGCDDDNTFSNDGCSSGCQVEAHYTCATEGELCTLNCEVEEALWTQGGCDATENCTLDDAGNTIQCLASGTTPDYAACSATTECQVGAWCNQLPVQSDTYCTPFCDPSLLVDNLNCGTDGLCLWNMTVDTTYVGLCQHEDTCDPIDDSAPVAGCSGTTPMCYMWPFNGGMTYCGAAGTTAIGQPCGWFDECVPGASCISSSGNFYCFEICRWQQNGDCSGGRSCNSRLGTTPWGICST